MIGPFGRQGPTATLRQHCPINDSKTLYFSAKDSLFSLVKGCTDATYPLTSEANHVHQIIASGTASGTANESSCFLTDLVPVDSESHQPMKLTDVRYNKRLLVCNEEVLMWLGSSFLCNQMGCLLLASGIMITWL